MKAAFELINKMQRDGVIDRYALGGAVGATLYLEPASTLDIDIFARLSGTAGNLLVSLSPIYEYLKQHGGRAEGEHIVIGGWPVQFLPVSTALEEEALHQAVETEIEGVPVWVMRAEHLAAIALQTGRSKDHARILQFLEQDAFDQGRLERILNTYGLASRWEKFKARFLSE